MEDHLPDSIDGLCERIKEVLWEFPEPVRTPKDGYFAIDNLWKIEIRSTCEQAVEYVRAIRLLIDDGLDRPAAALSRSIHELRIRFHYLSAHEEELPDWFNWQISHDYHATLDILKCGVVQTAGNERGRQRLCEEIRDIEGFLGEVPVKRNYPWKGARSMLQDVKSGFGPEAYGPLYRQLIADPSDYVHIHVTGRPNLFEILQLSEISFAATVKRAMQLCAGKQLLGPSAPEIEVLCDQVLRRTLVFFRQG